MRDIWPPDPIHTALSYPEPHGGLTLNYLQHSGTRHRQATKDLLSAASQVPEQACNPSDSRRNETPKAATAHLISAGQRYRMNPSIAACERILAMAINWYSVEGRQDPTETGATSET